MRIPFISRFADNGNVRATFALSMTAIGTDAGLAVSKDPLQRITHWREAHEQTVRLISMIARWPHPVACELHLVSEPSLLPDVPGRNGINILWYVRGNSETAATELALSDSFKIDVLLKTFWPNCEWSYVKEDQFQKIAMPFQPRSCLTVCHRSEHISSTQPFIIDRGRIGFQPTSGSEPSLITPTILEHIYPWVPPLGEDLSSLMDSLLCMPSPRWIIVRLSNDQDKRHHARAIKRLETSVNACERLLAGLESDHVPLLGQTQAIRNASLNRYAQLSDCSLRGSILVMAPGEPDFTLATILGQCITGDHARRQIESPLEGGFTVGAAHPSIAERTFEFPEEEPWAPEEAACAFRLPIIDFRGGHGLAVKRHRTVELQYTSTDKSCLRTILGVNLHQGMTRKIELGIEDRLHHALYIGATGTGKSSALLSSMLQDANAGIGFTLIDPPGDLADDLLARFPKERAEDLIIVDLEDHSRPIPMNLLAWTSPEERDLIIDTLYSTLLSVYKSPDFFGPVFEQHFRSGLRLLLGDQADASDFVPTLLEFPQVLRNRAFRTYLKSRILDAEILDAIEEAERVTSGDATLSNIAPYITSKFNRFLQDAQLRRIVGHGSMAIDFRQAMDTGKIIVFKLAQGRVGKSTASILLAQIVARFRLAAMSRAEIPRASRKPYFLYIDECQVLADSNVADMLSQCRKYGLGLVLANQYVGQLRERGVLGAVLGNVGTLATFRVSADDATLLESAFLPTVTAHDIVECPNWSGYMRLYSSRSPLPPFSFSTLPPDAIAPNSEWAEELKETSRQRWGVLREEVDDRITARRRRIRNMSTPCGAIN